MNEHYTWLTSPDMSTQQGLLLNFTEGSGRASSTIRFVGIFCSYRIPVGPDVGHKTYRTTGMSTAQLSAAQ